MKLPERGSCRWEPREGNFRTTATLVEGRVDRFSDGSSTLPASTSDSQGFGNRTLAVLFMDFSQCDCEAGAKKPPAMRVETKSYTKGITFPIT